ncbi:hypothetical protein C4556_01975 [Candidatus Parcubacteria bacterium]|nr:MAG: hypothetical protein C4556_01975 [Candidatus Parcubacteria bacterium]
MVNTITDTWAFGGGVLRAMQAHTLLPGVGVDYGTLSFYQNYLAMAVALGFGYMLSGFDLEALKTVLILNPSYSLLVPRITSALTAVVFLVIVYRFLKVHVESAPWRLALLMLTFGNVLAVILTRSGKMWMLSTALGVISFIYLYRAITEEVKTGPGRLSVTSILTAFLATANFPFAAVFLVNIPILLYVLPRTHQSILRLLYAIAAGAIAFLAVFLLNAENIIGQVSGFVLQFFDPLAPGVASGLSALTPFESFMVNARQGVEAFPLLLLALIPAFAYGIRDKTLAYLALIYGAVYIVAVAVVFRTDHGLALNVRHIFPLCFFLLFLIAAWRPPSRSIAVSFFIVGASIYVYSVVLLSIPTTYNAAADFIESRYTDTAIRIDEHIWELTLPMNKASYGLFASSSCGSTCQHVQELPRDIAFRPLVVTNETDPATLATLPPPDLVVVERAIAGCAPLARFGNNVPDDEVFDIDINLGRMLLPSFYTLRQLGKNIYIYDAKECPGS